MIRRHYFKKTKLDSFIHPLYHHKHHIIILRTASISEFLTRILQMIEGTFTLTEERGGGTLHISSQGDWIETKSTRSGLFMRMKKSALLLMEKTTLPASEKRKRFCS